jgi:hypothetical protein
MGPYEREYNELWRQRDTAAAGTFLLTRKIKDAINWAQMRCAQLEPLVKEERNAV